MSEEDWQQRQKIASQCMGGTWKPAMGVPPFKLQRPQESVLRQELFGTSEFEAIKICESVNVGAYHVKGIILFTSS
jgi:hypothetical protein